MRLKTKLKIRSARRKAERKLGFGISDKVAKEILDYCIQKLPYIKKGEDYLPILYECTIPQRFQMAEINRATNETMRFRSKEDENDVCSMRSNAMPSTVS